MDLALTEARRCPDDARSFMERQAPVDVGRGPAESPSPRSSPTCGRRLRAWLARDRAAREYGGSGDSLSDAAGSRRAGAAGRCQARSSDSGVLVP